MEERLVKALQDSRDVTDKRFATVQEELQCIKGGIKREISIQVTKRYAQLEGSIADTHAKYMAAREDLSHQMKEIGQIHEKAKDMVHLAHEARNKYNIAIKDSSQTTQYLTELLKQTQDRLLAWDSQMAHLPSCWTK